MENIQPVIQIYLKNLGDLQAQSMRKIHLYGNGRKIKTVRIDIASITFYHSRK